MCRCSTVAVHPLAVSISMSYRFQTLRHARWWLLEQLGEVGSSGDRQAGVVAALGGPAVARGIERNDLLDRHWLPLLELQGEVVGNEPGLLDDRAIHFDNLAVA